MFRNYFKIAFRNLIKHKLFSITNILGLSIGVICCLLILLYVSHELSYDQWNPNAERLVRPYSDINFGGTVMNMAVTGAVVAPDSYASLPEIEDWCRFRNYGSYLVQDPDRQQQNIEVKNALSVDSSFFRLFPITLLQGDPVHCLKRPKNMAVSESLAEKIFGSVEGAMDKTLQLDNDQVWKITGIFKDIPSVTHFKADMLLSLNGNEEIKNSPPLWAANNNFHTYFLLRKGINYEDFRTKFEVLSREKMEITSSTLLGMTLSEFEATGQYARFSVQRVPDIHLQSNLQVELQPNGNIRYVWIFSFVAFFVLLIACINFMNLTTAKSSQRSKEIAVRKVMGSNRQMLIVQFLSEALVITLLSVVIAVLVSALAMPWYSNITGADLQLPWRNLTFWLTLCVGVLVVAVLAGSYPAFFLSAFRPIQALGNREGKMNRDKILRSALVVIQFTIATVLIIGTLIITKQLRFIQNKDLGFHKEQIIVLNEAYALGNQVESFKQELLQQPSVSSATISSYLPIPSSRSNSTYSQAREFREDIAINMDNWYIDHDYADTYGLSLKEGRFFEKNYGSDSSGVVLNESAISVLGYEDPIGKKIYGLTDNVQGAPAPEDFEEFTIVGVVKDFHFESLRENIGALGFFLGKSNGAISFRYDAGNTDVVIRELESTWRKMAPNQPFSYRFVDEGFAQLYDSETRVATITKIFALLAILVSCLGLFGLSTFIIEQRSKEISIRKVLGASILNIVRLLSKSFLRLVLIGIVIAIPITWYAGKDWLTNFAYRTELHWSIFLAAAFIAVLIAFVTVSFQSVRAATANPINAIRTE